MDKFGSTGSSTLSSPKKQITLMLDDLVCILAHFGGIFSHQSNKIQQEKKGMSSEDRSETYKAGGGSTVVGAADGTTEANE